MNFLKKLFGGRKKETGSPVETLVRSTLEGLIENGQFDLEYTLTVDNEDEANKLMNIELSGGDEDLF